MKQIARVLAPLVIGMTLMIGLVPAAARAEGATDAQTQVKNAYLNQCELIKAANFAAFTATMTDDYVQINVDGKKATRAETVAALRMVVTQTGLHINDCGVTVDSSQRSGDDLTITVTLVQKGVIPRQGSAALLEDTTRERDVWTQTDGKWLQKSETILGELTKLNGDTVEQSGTFSH